MASANILKKYELKGVEDTGRELAQGCYYTRCTEMSYKGLKCVARTICPEFMGMIVTGGERCDQVEHVYESYCSQLLELRHPHLLQFIGFRYEQNQLSILVEQLPVTLFEALERYGRLPDEVSYSILKDVALGMVYLHSRSPTPVVHGELTASNVHLTMDMSAKIADTGVSELLNLSPSRRKMIGHKALAHIPPETLALPSTTERSPSRSAQIMLSKKLDSYSFGVLMVYTLSGKFPEHIARWAYRLCGMVLNSPNAADDDDDDLSISSSKNIMLDNVLGEVNADHPLASLILQCISQTADLRPELSQILSTITEMMLQYPAPTLERRLNKIHSIIQSSSKTANQADAHTKLKRKDSITTLANSLEIEHLKLQIEELHVENRGLRTSLTKQKEMVNARDHEMAAKLMAKDQEIITKHQELSAQEAMMESYRATIRAKEGTLSVLSSQMQRLQNYITTKNEVS